MLSCRAVPNSARVAHSELRLDAERSIQEENGCAFEQEVYLQRFSSSTTSQQDRKNTVDCLKNNGDDRKKSEDLSHHFAASVSIRQTISRNKFNHRLTARFVVRRSSSQFATLSRCTCSPESGGRRDLSVKSFAPSICSGVRQINLTPPCF